MCYGDGGHVMQSLSAIPTTLVAPAAFVFPNYIVSMHVVASRFTVFSRGVMHCYLEMNVVFHVSPISKRQGCLTCMMGLYNWNWVYL